MPADINAATWSTTDSSNNSAAPTGAPEGMAPGGVNDVLRAHQGALKRWHNHVSPTVTTGGTATAMTLTYDVAPTSYVNGDLYTFTLNANIGAAATLNVNALGAKSIYKWDGSAWAAVAASDVLSGQQMMVAYNSGADRFYILSPFIIPATITGTKTFSAAVNFALGANIASATTTDIGAATGNTVHITGTTTITGLGTAASGIVRDVIFDGALTLTHNATSLILQGGSNITTAAGDTARFVSEGSGNWRCLQYQRTLYAPDGEQTVYATTTAVSTGTTAIPGDDTIPQNTEGDQYITASITPKSATSRLIINVTLNISSSATDNPIIALFQDSTANALAAVVTRIDSATIYQCVTFTHVMTSGTTSSTTFKVRAGTTAAATITVNGSGGARKLGGVYQSSIVIREVFP